MKKLIILSFTILLLCGCENKICIRSHEEESTCLSYTYIYNNGVLIPISHYYPCTKTICDEYEVIEE